MKHFTTLTVALLASLTGCASLSGDDGFNRVQQIANDKLGTPLIRANDATQKSLIAERRRELLQAPLSMDRAVELALINHPGLQAEYWKLGLAQAAVVQATRLPNPHLALLRASHLDGGVREYKIEQVLTFNLFSLLTKPQEYAIASTDFIRTQNEVAHSVLRHAWMTRKAWVDAVAAQEAVKQAERALAASEASAELARRMASTGNINRLQQAREHSLYAEAAATLAAERGKQDAARLALARLLGLWGSDVEFTLPERLPDLPAQLPDPGALEKKAITERLDLQIVKLDTEALARQLGLTRTTRFINVLEVGPARVQEGPSGSPYKTGVEIAFELPLFDWGGAKVASAQARYERQLLLATQAAIDARTQVRQAIHQQHTQFEIARHYRDHILPLAKRISEENLLRYNGMLIGTLELLADTRAQIATIRAAVEARRAFWLAQADLDMALVGAVEVSAAAAPAIKTAASAGH